MTLLSMLISTLNNSPLKVEPLYLDPGSGSFLIQLLVASLLGAVFVIRASWGKIIIFFKRVFSKSTEEEQTETEEDE